MKSSKKWAAMALAATLVATVVSAPTALADEGSEADEVTEATVRSTQDYPVDFGFWFYGATQGTNPEYKEDSSSSYIWVKNEKSIDWCYVFIDGSDSTDLNTFANRTTNLSTGWSGGSCTVSTPGEFQIYNTVKEDGNLFWARLTGRAEGPTGTLPGMWSADSWGIYPIINNHY